MIETFKIYSFSNLQIWNTVLLTILTMLYITFSQDFILYLEAYTFWPSSPISPTFYFWEPSICSLYLWAFFKKKNKNYFTYKEDHAHCVSLCSLFPLSNMPSRSTRVVSSARFLKISFLSIALSLSMHPLMDAWIVHILAVIKSAAENMGVQISFEFVLWFSSDKHPEVELWDHPVVAFLIFEELSYYFPQLLIQSTFPTAVHKGFPFPHILAYHFSRSWFHLCILYFLPSCIFIFLPVLQVSFRLFFRLNLFCSNGSLTLFPRGQALGNFWRHQASISIIFFPLLFFFLPFLSPSLFCCWKPFFRYMLFCISGALPFPYVQDVLWITLWFHLFSVPYTSIGNVSIYTYIYT